MKSVKVTPAAPQNMAPAPSPKAKPALKMEKQEKVKAGKVSSRGGALKKGSIGAALKGAPSGAPAKSKFKPVKSLAELKARAKKMGA